MRLTVMSCCVTFAAGAIAYAVACGGRVEEPGCPPSEHLCTAAVVCCSNTTACGTGANGCPFGSCCPLVDEPGEGTPATATQGYSVPSPPAPAPAQPSASISPRQQ